MPPLLGPRIPSRPCGSSGRRTGRTGTYLPVPGTPVTVTPMLSGGTSGGGLFATDRQPGLSPRVESPGFGPGV